MRLSASSVCLSPESILNWIEDNPLEFSYPTVSYRIGRIRERGIIPKKPVVARIARLEPKG